MLRNGRATHKSLSDTLLINKHIIMKRIKLFKVIQEWFYFFKHGHEFLLKEEVDIICEVRLNKYYKSLSDNMIQKLIKVRIKRMYQEKYPNAKPWSLSNF